MRLRLLWILGHVWIDLVLALFDRRVYNRGLLRLRDSNWYTVIGRHYRISIFAHFLATTTSILAGNRHSILVLHHARVHARKILLTSRLSRISRRLLLTHHISRWHLLITSLLQWLRL